MTIVGMLANALGRAVSYLPNLIAAAVILAVGFLVAKLLEKAARGALGAIGRRRAARQLVDNEASLERLANGGGRLVYWVLGLITIGLAVDALNLPWLSHGVARVVAYVPHLFAAAIIAAAGYLGGNFLYRQISAKEGPQSLLGRLARGAIYAFAGFMALQELGVATAIVTMGFVIVLGALAIAGALSFGLGNRELAGRITRDWYEHRRPTTYQSFESTSTLSRDQRDEEERRNPTQH
jgi:hypothetical protein